MPPTSTYTRTDDIDSDLTDIEGDDESEDELQEEEQIQNPVQKQSTPLSSSASTSKLTSRPTRSSSRKPKKEPTPEEDFEPDLETPLNRPMPCIWLYNVVWNDSKQTYLIDSILNNHSVSEIIFGVKKSKGMEMRTCIDGKQRLTSIRRFMNGEIPYKSPKTSCKYWWTTSNVKGRKEIPERLRERFSSATITCLDYRNITDDQERDLFSRVQNGVALTCAERLQSINGPLPTLIRVIKRQVNDAFNNNVNWGKDRGRDFQVTAQALYLIESSMESGKMPTQPTTGQIEKWLISQSQKDQVKEPFRRKTHEVIAMLCGLVVDPKLGEPFSMAKYNSKFSAMEFMMTAYMITLYAKEFSNERLSVAVECIRKHAQRESHGEAKFNSKAYKYLLTYVRRQLKLDVQEITGKAPQTPAQQYWEKKASAMEATRQQVKKEVKREVKKEIKKDVRKETKFKVDKAGDTVMGDDTQGEDSDVPLMKNLKRKHASMGCNGGADEDDAPKHAKAKRKLATSASTSAMKQETKPKEKVVTKGGSKETLVHAPKSRLDKVGRIPKTSSSTPSKSQTPLPTAPAPPSATALPKASAKKPIVAPIDTKIAAGSASKQVASRTNKPGPSSSSSMMVSLSIPGDCLPEQTDISRRHSSIRSFPAIPDSVRLQQSESISRPTTPQSQLSQTPASATFPENPPIRTIQQDIMSGASLSGPGDVARPSPSGSMSPLTPVPPSMSASTSSLGRGRPTGNERTLSSSSSRLANLRAARGASMSTSTFTTTPTPIPTTDPRLRSKSTGTTSGAGSTVAQPDTARSTVSAQPQWLALSNEIYKSFQDVSLSSTSEVPSTQPPSSSLPSNSMPPQTAQNQRSPALPPTAPRADRGRTVSAHQSGLAPQPGHRYHPYQRQESPPRLLKIKEVGEVCASPKPLMPKDEELPVSRLPTPPLSAGLPTKPSYDHWEPGSG
ncbi:hypothetical protein VNI00_019405 [Paramarasmius palmivorus]|uniref:GmrSD restriction endonucleases N-terminal domain-containing protein n=1 Tax=Paramarasmius palmivorus TaxID=297713 RepID=A0AAW0AMA1_9AGAR